MNNTVFAMLLLATAALNLIVLIVTFRRLRKLNDTFKK